jgi:hypothetical protein
VPDTLRDSALTVAQPHASPAEPPAIDAEKRYALAELIDIAQRVNPDTRIAWDLAQRVPLPIPKTVRQRRLDDPGAGGRRDLRRQRGHDGDRASRGLQHHRRACGKVL